MREYDLELLRVIKEYPNPEKAMKVAIDIMSRCVAGEDMESIAASYGIVMTADGRFERV